MPTTAGAHAERATDRTGQSAAALRETTAAASDELRWTAHPAAERPLAAAAALLVILLLCGSVYVFAGHGAWVAFAALALGASLHPFFLPTRYRMDGQGIQAAGLTGARGLAWHEVRCLRIGSRAAWVAPSGARGPRSARRGVLVLYGRDPDRVRAMLADRARRLECGAGAESAPPRGMREEKS